MLAFLNHLIIGRACIPLGMEHGSYSDKSRHQHVGAFNFGGGGEGRGARTHLLHALFI